MSNHLRFLAALPCCVAAVAAQQQYPEGVDIPRALTAAEAAWIAQNPLAVAGDAPTPPPTGPVRCAAEYEPMDGLCLAYEGTSAQLAIVQQIARHVTTTGQARAFVYCDTASEAATATSALAAAGCDMARVVTLVATTDTIWIREIGRAHV